jgi:hypothetical protein
MERKIRRSALLLIAFLAISGCEGLIGPNRQGEIKLSSQFFGTDSYYLFGYAYEQGEFYRYPYQGEPIPDIINEAFRLVGGDIKLLPGFNTPARTNGFALVGEFENLSSARDFYDTYVEVESDLQFEVTSDTVELYQVWVQKTSIDNYVKMLVTDIQNLEGEGGVTYNEVSLEYTYQPNGTSTFPD